MGPTDNPQDPQGDAVKMVGLRNLIYRLKLKLSFKSSRSKKFAFFSFLIILVFLVYGLFAALMIKTPALGMLNSIKASMQSIQDKDLDKAESNLQSAKDNLKKAQSKYRLVSWMKYIPLLGGYIKDGQHGLIASDHGLKAADLVITAIKPYADVLGLKGAESELNAESAEEKIIFILDTLDKISPEMENISHEVALIEVEISQINPKRYPVSFQGTPVRAQLITIQESLKSAKDTLSNIKPLLKLLPKLLGQPDPQTYLLVFQNNAELRPSGGFLTAYAILEAHRGKVTPKLSKDIYSLDALFGNRLPAPEPIKKYLPLVYNWHLRDMNLSPDFKVSMDTFYPHYKEVAEVKDVDGIIAIDTQLPVDLLKVLGEVGVAQWGKYNADIVPECDCPQIVYKMEDYATRPTYYIKTDRKGMIGPLMHAILLHVMNSPKKLWPQFIEIGLKNIREKHLMFYFTDKDMQEVAESFNAAGRVKDADNDYFLLVDTNFGGAKSNLFVEQEITQEIQVDQDGTIEKTVTIIYTNPHPPSDCNLESGGLCLNGLLRDWVRLYVPEGSELIEVLGSDINPTTNKELDKTTFEAFIELRPESRTKLIYKYRLPFKLEGNDDLNMFIQKQPGTKNHHYTIIYNQEEQEFDLDGDRELIL